MKKISLDKVKNVVSKVDVKKAGVCIIVAIILVWFGSICSGSNRSNGGKIITDMSVVQTMIFDTLHQEFGVKKTLTLPSGVTFFKTKHDMQYTLALADIDSYGTFTALLQYYITIPRAFFRSHFKDYMVMLNSINTKVAGSTAYITENDDKDLNLYITPTYYGPFVEVNFCKFYTQFLRDMAKSLAVINTCTADMNS